MKNKQKSAKRGFTLIELLVVVLIIGILAAIALPQYQYAIFKTKMKEAETMLTAIHRARQMYKLATGTEATKFDQLDTELPAYCQRMDSSYTPWPGWQDTIICKDFQYGIASFTTLVWIKFKEPSSFAHFDKLYPSGVFSCREPENAETLYRKYCQEMGYNIIGS